MPNRNVQVTEEKLNQQAQKVIAEVLKKNADYGNSWQDLDIFTPLIRMREKLVRVETLMDGRKALVVVEEDVMRTLLDLAGYSLLGMILESEQGGSK